MILDASAVRAPFGDDQPSGNDSREPAPLTSDSRCEPRFPIENSEKFLHINDLRLDLDHEQRPRRFVPSQKIDPAPVGVESKGHLRSNCPSSDFAEPACDGALENGVPSVQEPVELAASPSGKDVEPNVEDGSHAPQGVNRHRPDVPSFDRRDERVGHAGLLSDVDLPPAPADADGTEGGAYALIRHPCQCVGRGLSAGCL